MSAIWEGYRLRPRTLSGATVLQMLPDGRDSAAGRAALTIASALIEAGARTIVAGESGPATERLRAAGAEWLALDAGVINPLKMRRGVRMVERFAITERVDIVHAFGAAPAWMARMAAKHAPMWVVTSLPDRPVTHAARSLVDAGLARGDRVIASSAFVARPWIEQAGLAPDRVVLIPHQVDLRNFAPQAVAESRIDAIRRAWGVQREDRIALVPGPYAPPQGQMLALDALRLLAKTGARRLALVLTGDSARHAAEARALMRRAETLGVASLVRIAPMPTDAPAALAAAHVLATPISQPPCTASIVAQAQAMGVPAVASQSGVLPEMVLAPPRIAEALRTGWLTPPGDAVALARALQAVLALDPVAYQALSARARAFAEFAFAPERVAAAIRGVYTSLLARDA